MRPSAGRRSREVPGPPGESRAWPLPGLAAAALVLLTLLGMEAWTISSRTPRLRDLPGLLPSDVENLRVWGVDSPFSLAERTPRGLSDDVPGVDAAEASRWIDIARLATLRGMGTRNARILDRWGISSPADLARTDPDALARCFESYGGGVDIGRAQVRVWWRAARSEIGLDPAPDGSAPCAEES